MAKPTNAEIEKVITESLITFGADPAAISRDAELEALDIDFVRTRDDLVAKPFLQSRV